MMFKRLNFICIIVVLSSLICNAQTNGKDNMFIQQITGSPFINYAAQYEGSPFFNEEWYKASVKLSGGEIYQGLKVKLDVYRDELVYYNATLGKSILVDKDIIDEIYLENEEDGSELLIKNSCIQGDDNQFDCSFYFIHFDDSISLWSKQKKALIKDQSSTGDQKEGYFTSDIDYYIVVNGEHTPVRINKKAIAKKFPGNKQLIIRCINENHLDLEKPGHLSFLFQKINEFERKNPGN